MILALVAKANTMPLLLTILPDSPPVFISVVVLQILLEILVPIFEIRLCTTPFRTRDIRTWRLLIPPARYLWLRLGVVLFMLKNLGFFGMDGDIASLLKSRDIDLRASPIWARVFMMLSTVFLVPFRVAIARVSAYETEDKKDNAGLAPSWPLSPPPRPAHLSREMVLAVYPTIVMEEGWGALWAGWGWTALWQAIEPF